MSIGLIVDGFRRIFSGSNVLAKQVSLFALTGIVSLVSSHFELLKAQSSLPDLSNIGLSIIAVIVIGIYMGGYVLNYMHNCYDDNNPEILPDIDGKHFGTFLGALPLYLVWFLWVILVYLLAIIPILGWIALLVLFIMWVPFIQFVYIAYAKHFNTFGLYNIKLPIKYCKLAFGSVVVLGLLFIPIGICAMIPSFVVGLALGLSGGSDTSTAMYAGGLLGGYLGFVVQLVWAYCMVQVYKEKIEPNLDLD